MITVYVSVVCFLSVPESERVFWTLRLDVSQAGFNQVILLPQPPEYLGLQAHKHGHLRCLKRRVRISNYLRQGCATRMCLRSGPRESVVQPWGSPSQFQQCQMRDLYAEVLTSLILIIWVGTSGPSS